METVTHIHTATGISDFVKSSQLMATLQTQLEASLTPDQYLIDICHVLINQQHQTLTDIATNILHQLGKYTLMSSTVITRKFGGEFIVNFCNDRLDCMCDVTSCLY